MSGGSFYFDAEAEGMAVFLGPIEARLMDIGWSQGAVTVKQAIFHLGRDHRLAYTTVMTVLNRLTEKGLMNRTREGRNFVYEPVPTRDEFIAERTGRILACLKKNFPKALPRR